MNPSLLLRTAALALSLAACATSSAHISYSGRDFGSFSGGEGPVTILNKSVSGNFSWADGTDADYGSSELMRAYRFTLTYNATVTIDVSATTNNGALLGDLFPAFSIYSGLGHLPPDALDHDEAPVSGLWRTSIGGVVKEGNFRALGDWKVGNDTGVTEADLSSFIYRGHAADGTAANFGNEPGITGDGLLDGHVIGTFNLGPGNYSLFIGGAVYGAQVPGDTTARGVNVTFSAIPEPTAALLLSGIAGLLINRRRR